MSRGEREDHGQSAGEIQKGEGLQQVVGGPAEPGGEGDRAVYLLPPHLGGGARTAQCLFLKNVSKGAIPLVEWR